MKKIYIYAVWLATVGAVLSSCSDFLNREPITVPNNQSFLSGESQVRSYVNGLYISLPSLAKFGMGVRGEEKNSDNILSEVYNKRLNGEETLFSSNKEWEDGYVNLRDANYFFHYYLIPEEKETEEIKSLKGEVYFFRAYWHFKQLRSFGNIPIMDAFWDEHATVDGLQIPQADRAEVAKFILQDLEKAVELLYKRNKYGGLRINKEAAMLLAMQVALYEGTWEKYHASTPFAAATNQSDYFLREVIKWGDLLFQEGIVLNDMHTDAKAVNSEDPFVHLFTETDYSGTPEALFWRKYSDQEGIFHGLSGLIAVGTVDQDGPAGISGDLVNTYLSSNGIPINPKEARFKDFNETFKNRDLRLTATIMSSGYKFRSSSTGSLPMKVQEYATLEEGDYVRSPNLTNDGSAQSVTGYHIRLGVDTTYVSGNSETGLVLMRYADALLSYAEAAEELGICTDEILEKTLKPLRERAGVEYKRPVTVDPNFTNYGYILTPNLQEIRRERRVELALQGYRLDDLMRWRSASVFVGKRGRGAYLGKDGVLYQSFAPDAEERLNLLLRDGEGWLDPLQELLPNGYQFNTRRDYLLPIPPSELELNKLMVQNPGWN